MGRKLDLGKLPLFSFFFVSYDRLPTQAMSLAILFKILCATYAGDLGDEECEHILQVINRDSRLRQQEQERLQQREKQIQEEAYKTGKKVVELE